MGSNSFQQAACSSANGTDRQGQRFSYADWITQAILSSPDGKLTLACIYAWMAKNVPGLFEKRHLHSAKGWKNAVRHTLSINKRFVKTAQVNARSALWSLVPVVNSEVHRSPGYSPQTEFNHPAHLTRKNTTLALCPAISPVTPPTDLLDEQQHAFRTQTLEMHNNDGTVRTVTVPKPYPIHVVSDYKLISFDSTTQNANFRP